MKSTSLWICGTILLFGAMAFSTPASQGSNIVRGIIYDVTPDLSDDMMTRLSELAEEESFGDHMKGQTAFAFLNELLGRRRSGVEVRLEGDGVDLQTTTDQDGLFIFMGVPDGKVVMTAHAPSLFPESGGQLEALGKRRLHLPDDGRVQQRMEISPYSVVLRGNVMNFAKQPIGGAKISALRSRSEVPRHIYAETVSLEDGTFTFEYLPPPNVFFTTGYLNGGDPTDGGLYRTTFFVDICAEKQGYTQQQGCANRIPLINEPLAAIAQRLKDHILHIMRNLDGVNENDIEQAKNHKAALPQSKGNEITGITIILEQIERPPAAEKSAENR